MTKTSIFAALAASLALSLAAVPANAGEVLDRVLAAKTLKVATDANWAPQSFVNDKNEMDGFDVDVAKEIGKFARPDEIRFADGLPKTRSGKIMRRLLKDVAAGREAQGDISTLEDLNVLAKLRGNEE